MVIITVHTDRTLAGDPVHFYIMYTLCSRNSEAGQLLSILVFFPDEHCTQKQQREHQISSQT